MTELTLHERHELVTALGRFQPDALERTQLDQAMALLLFDKLRFSEEGEGVAAGVLVVYLDEVWQPFSPMTSATDFLHLLTNTNLVVGTHGGPDYAVGEETEDATRHWYSCHAYVSGTSTEGWDIREVVCESAARLLFHQASYSPRWQRN